MNPVEFLTSALSHAAGLHVLCLRLFGTGYLAWEAETIWAELQRRCGATPSNLNKDKINACRTLHISEQPYEDWNLFEKIIVALNNTPVMFDTMQKPPPAAIAHGVTVISTLRAQPFSYDVELYITGVLLDAGLVYPPEPLLFVSDKLEKHVPRELFLAMQRLNSVSKMSLPRDEALAYQVLRLRSIEDYLRKMQVMYTDGLATAKRLAGELGNA